MYLTNKSWACFYFSVVFVTFMANIRYKGWLIFEHHFFLHAKRYFIQSINIKRLKNVGAIICPRNILIDSDWAQYFPGVFYLHFFKRALNPEYLNFSEEIKFEWTPWTFHLRINNLINGDVVQCSKRCIGQEKRSYSNI